METFELLLVTGILLIVIGVVVIWVGSDTEFVQVGVLVIMLGMALIGMGIWVNSVEQEVQEYRDDQEELFKEFEEGLDQYTRMVEMDPVELDVGNYSEDEYEVEYVVEDGKGIRVTYKETVKKDSVTLTEKEEEEIIRYRELSEEGEEYLNTNFIYDNFSENYGKKIGMKVVVYQEDEEGES